MLTEKDISALVQREIKSPIRVGNLSQLGIDEASFLEFFQPFFEELEDDHYLTRQNQLQFLLEKLPQHQAALTSLHKDYFEGSIGIEALAPYTIELEETEKTTFEQLSVITRQRSIAAFELTWTAENMTIEAIDTTKFQQNVQDFRVWKRVFAPTNPKAIEVAWFQDFLKAIGEKVREIHPSNFKLHITVHFMRSLAYENIVGENAPEGIHEDGTHYIVSALVINRKNALGGESSIYEKLNNKQQQLLYKKILQPGDFIFQADTGEEITFGNDLWHNVSAIHPKDLSQVATRDIIGLDIDLL